MWAAIACIAFLGRHPYLLLPPATFDISLPLLFKLYYRTGSHSKFHDIAQMQAHMLLSLCFNKFNDIKRVCAKVRWAFPVVLGQSLAKLLSGCVMKRCLACCAGCVEHTCGS